MRLQTCVGNVLGSYSLFIPLLLIVLEDLRELKPELELQIAARIERTPQRLPLQATKRK